MAETKHKLDIARLEVPDLSDQTSAAPGRSTFRMPLDSLDRKILIALAVTGEDESLFDLADTTGLDPAELENALARLVIKGFIERIEARPADEADDEDDVFDEAEFKAIAAAAEQGEAPPEPEEPEEDLFTVEALRNYLESLKDSHYYDMLGIAPQAGLAEIRRVYYQLVASYHPDQHREVDDREIIELLSDIFGLLTEAYETLRNKDRRKKYDRTIPEVTGVEENEEEEALAALFDEGGADLPAEPVIDAQPLGWSFYEAAVEAFQAGDYQTADLNFKLAAGMEPDRKEYQEGLEKNRDILNGLQLDELKRECKRLEEERKFQQAVAAYVKAVEIDPTNAELRYNLARLRFLKTLDRLRAEEDVSWAVALAPDHVEALLLMVRIQAWKGSTGQAVKTFKQVLNIVPGHQKAKQALSLFEGN